jgi:RNA polymerase sigma-70 factor (ECF subfamily)
VFITHPDGREVDALTLDDPDLAEDPEVLTLGDPKLVQEQRATVAPFREPEPEPAETAAAETLAFDRAIRAATGLILDDFREKFRQEYTFDEQITELEDSMRLFAAMARLPERQFDVMVLHYALAFDTKRTALVMGVCEATVRSTRRTAKRRLATELGLEMDEDANDEE